MRDDGPIATLAIQHGLARAPLFRDNETSAAGEHGLLLDGAFGSFAISVAREVDPRIASSWAWSSNVPHHVLVSGDVVSVVRWDAPANPESFTTSRVLADPATFYAHLRNDRTRDRKDVVHHSMDLFQRVRSLVHHAGIDDSRTVSAYLLLLGELYRRGSARDTVGSLALPPDASDVVSSLPSAAVEALLERYGHVVTTRSELVALPTLALRHASGVIFQEAHQRLEFGASPDLLDDVAPARSARKRKGTVHFTPPYLARALCEQAMAAFGSLGERKTLVVSDLACGSGAFLVEALRTLERLGYGGSVTLVGRDVSPAAIDMARFALHVAAYEWPGSERFTLDLSAGDSLSAGDLPVSDVTVMNPPFAQWETLDAGQRAVVMSMLGGASVGRSDQSMAFVTRALGRLATDGVLATLLPARLMYSASASKWRDSVEEGRSVFLAATFDDQRLFQSALVKVGALVVGPRTATPPLLVRARRGAEDTGEALRALRRGEAIDDPAVERATFSITRGREGTRESWTAPNVDDLLAKKCFEAGVPTVASLFKVSQGIRSGLDKAFVLDAREYGLLPPEERAYFRLAVDSDYVKDGSINGYYHLFYPFGPTGRIEDEGVLERSLPSYFSSRLRPNRERLAGRRGHASRWWELSWPRPDLKPVFASKYFAGPKGFVLHAPGDALILQGFGWTPIGPLSAALSEGAIGADLTAAYLTVLNSAAFLSLVEEQGSKSSGGQQDMSARFVDRVPLADLTRSLPDGHAPIRALATYARMRYLRTAEWSPVDDEGAERLVRVLFGLDEKVETRGRVRLQDGTPPWLATLVEGGLVGTGRDARTEAMVQMQALASAGTFDEIDAALDRAPVSALADTSMMALLRGSFRFRSRLSGWESFRDRVARELGTRKAPVEKLLCGLYR